MQTRGTFPELNSGMKKGKAKAKPHGVSFSVGTRPRRIADVPNTYAGRRAAAHNRYGK
jgi:hypothetical protein